MDAATHHSSLEGGCLCRNNKPSGFLRPTHALPQLLAAAFGGVEVWRSHNTVLGAQAVPSLPMAAIWPDQEEPWRRTPPLTSAATLTPACPTLPALLVCLCIASTPAGTAQLAPGTLGTGDFLGAGDFLGQGRIWLRGTLAQRAMQELL